MWATCAVMWGSGKPGSSASQGHLSWICQSKVSRFAEISSIIGTLWTVGLLKLLCVFKTIYFVVLICKKTFAPIALCSWRWQMVTGLMISRLGNCLVNFHGIFQYFFNLDFETVFCFKLVDSSQNGPRWKCLYSVSASRNWQEKTQDYSDFMLTSKGRWTYSSRQDWKLMFNV